MAKPWPNDFTCKMAVGRYSKEKHLKMGYHWATQIEADHPDMESLVKICGFADADEATDDSLGKELDLEGARKIQRSSSDPQAPSKFKAGDKVTLVKRITAALLIVGGSGLPEGHQRWH